MKRPERSRRRRLRRRLALRLAVLMLPAFFWSGVFAALAGVRPLERMVERVPDAAQVFVAVACPLLAAALGVNAIWRGEVLRGRRPDLCRFTLAAGVALFVFAVLAALRPA
jgi:hypothetical protein